jgi:hypothetical protein
MIAGVNGYYNGRVAFDAVNNRTANPQGVEGGNFELDLLNEFLNRELSGN